MTLPKEVPFSLSAMIDTTNTIGNSAMTAQKVAWTKPPTKARIAGNAK